MHARARDRENVECTQKCGIALVEMDAPTGGEGRNSAGADRCMLYGRQL